MVKYPLIVELNILKTGREAYLMKKVKNVINGYMSQFDIQEITIFDTDETVAFSGSYENFINTKEEDEIFFKEMNRILNADCEKCIPFNHSKLFIFLHRHGCYDCKSKTENGLCKHGWMYNCHGKEWEKREETAGG